MISHETSEKMRACIVRGIECIEADRDQLEKLMDGGLDAETVAMIDEGVLALSTALGMLHKETEP